MVEPCLARASSGFGLPKHLFQWSCIHLCCGMLLRNRGQSWENLGESQVLRRVKNKARKKAITCLCSVCGRFRGGLRMTTIERGFQTGALWTETGAAMKRNGRQRYQVLELSLSPWAPTPTPSNSHSHWKPHQEHLYRMFPWVPSAWVGCRDRGASGAGFFTSLTTVSVTIHLAAEQSLCVSP